MSGPRFGRALITGGSQGIGLALAHRLARAGTGLILVARREGPLEEARAAIAAASPGADVVVRALDVSDGARVAEVIDAVLRERPAELIVNNAGVTRPGRFLELPPDEFHRQMSVNFHGPVAVTRAAVPHLLRRGGGHVVNVGSIAGAIGVYGFSAYSASKYALHGFSECLRAELAPLGIRVSVVLPPETDTPMLAGEQAFLPAETRAIAGTITTLTADQVAAAILEGVARGRFEVIPGTAATWSVRLARAFPSLSRAYCDWRQRGASRTA